jgi:hypothetical protein
MAICGPVDISKMQKYFYAPTGVGRHPDGLATQTVITVLM